MPEESKEPLFISNGVPELAGKSEPWSELVLNRQLGSLLDEIDGLPKYLERQKPALRSQVYRLLGLQQQAYEEALKIDVNQQNLNIALSSADTASKAGAQKRANILLLNILKRLTLKTELENALKTSLRIKNSDLTDAIIERLANEFPDSTDLKNHFIIQSLVIEDYRSASEFCVQFGDLEAEAELFDWVANEMNKLSPNYIEAYQRMEEVQTDFRNAGRIAVLGEMLRRDFWNTVGFLSSRPELSEEEAWLLLRAISSLLTGPSRTNMSLLSRAVKAAINYLSSNPRQISIRNELIQLLSVERSGIRGLAVLSEIVWKLAPKKIDVIKKPGAKGLSIEEILTKPATTEAMNWIQKTGAILGAKVPAELAIEPRDEVTRGFVIFMGEPQQFSDANHVENYRILLALGVATAAHSSDKNADMIMMRLAAAQFVVAGLQQLARDYVENCMHLAEDNESRIRIAWCVMSDIYHRLGSHHESLLSIACALHSDAQIDEEEAIFEMLIVGRIYRDIGFFDQAAMLVDAMEKQMRTFSLFENSRAKREELRFSIAAQRALRNPQPGHTITQRINETVEYIFAHQKFNADILPNAITLGQLLKIAEKENVTAPEAATKLFEELLNELPPQQVDLVLLVSAKSPKPEKIFESFQRIRSTRYTSDVVSDTRVAKLAAVQLLSCSRTDPAASIFSIEVLADQAINDPASTKKVLANELTEYKDVAKMALEISRSGISLFFCAFDAEENLITVEVTNGRLVEPATQKPFDFSKKAFYQWKADYPYNYGQKANIKNFLDSTNNLRVRHFPRALTAVVSSARLQQLPPNLIRAGDEFAGTQIPICSVPSLSWLSGVLQKGNVNSSRRVAWIPTDGSLQLLHRVNVKLHATWNKFSIEVHTSATIPQHFGNSQLAIIAAHGGLAPEGTFFQIVSDDLDMSVHHSEIARALQDITVVILFVCNAGRIDTHPFADTTMGLVKELLNLGASTVIAPPWPLDADVIYDWLPEFLTQTDSGASVIEANFAANRLVATKNIRNPGRYLAMNVYGNPLTKII